MRAVLSHAGGVRHAPHSAIVAVPEMTHETAVSSEPPVEKPRSLAPAWITLALFIALLGGFEWKSGRDKAVCQLNTRNIQQAARAFHGMQGKHFGDRLDKGDLVGPGRFLDTEPCCPAGGTYIWSPVHPAIGTLAIRCSHRKHQLDPALIKDW